MILRRFTKHITEQNWFAVGLDVIVVITGIFLGMQVNNWNEGRKENLRIERTLDRLVGEIQGNVDSFRASLEDDRKLMSPLARAYKAALTCTTNEVEIANFEAQMIETLGSQDMVANQAVLRNILGDPDFVDRLSIGFLDRLGKYDLILTRAIDSFEGRENSSLDRSLDRLEITKMVADDNGIFLGSTLALATPFSKACKDKKLVKNLFLVVAIRELGIQQLEMLISESESLLKAVPQKVGKSQ